MTYRYFNRYVRIKYACGHTRVGTDTLREFVSRYAVTCPSCVSVMKRCRKCNALHMVLNEDGLCDICELEEIEKEV